MRTQRDEVLWNAALLGLEARLRRLEIMTDMAREALRQKKAGSPPLTWTAAQRRRQSWRMRAIWERRREKGR